MEEQKSLLRQDNNDFGTESLLGQNTDTSTQTSTLLGADDTMSFAELNNDVLSEAEIERRKKYFSDPKNQAEILLQNYIKNQQILVNHSQRRKIYAEFYRNAKKGKYKKIFHEQIYGVSYEESKKNFAKLND